MESDCSEAIRILSLWRIGNYRIELSDEIKNELHSCKLLLDSLDAVRLSHVRREGNAVAHLFAARAINLQLPFLFTEKPSWAIDVFSGDLEPFGF